MLPVPELNNARLASSEKRITAFGTQFVQGAQIATVATYKSVDLSDWRLGIAKLFQEFLRFESKRIGRQIDGNAREQAGFRAEYCADNYRNNDRRKQQPSSARAESLLL